MLCEVLNLASQRLPIRHTASHTAPDTRYTLHSRPDRPRTLLQEKRRTNHTVHLPDRVVRSNTARTSSLHIPILHFQSADHRNRSDHTHNLKNTGRRNHCHATCSYPLYPETLFRKLSRDRTPDGTVLTPQIVPRRHGSRSEIRPSETSQNSIPQNRRQCRTYILYSAPDHATSPHPWHGYALPSTSHPHPEDRLRRYSRALCTTEPEQFQDPRNRYHPAPRSDQHGQLLGWRTVNHIPSAEITLLKPVHVFHYLGFA